MQRWVLEAAGASFGDVVRVGIYLTDLGHFTAVNDVMKQYFAEPYPARSTIGVAALPRGAAGVERVPEGFVLPPAEALAEAQRLLDEGMPFHAHEVLEASWKSAPEAERELWQGLAQARAGARLSDISHAIERSAATSGPYGIVAEYTGHGIGTEMHMDPVIRNYGPPGQGPRLRPGMALAIEPMITRGERHVAELEDGWTVITTDGSRAAHFEHTIAITGDGPWVLTARDEEKARAADHPERLGLTLRRPAISVPDGGPDAE